MTAKKGTKIDVAKVAEEASKLGAGESIKILSIAGVVKGFRLKHSELGSGFVFKGSFRGKYRYDEYKMESDSLILPLEIGLRIAKACKGAGKNSVRFAVEISATISSMLVQGYSWHLRWTTEPEALGQQDLIKEMLEKQLLDE